MLEKAIFWGLGALLATGAVATLLVPQRQAAGARSGGARAMDTPPALAFLFKTAGAAVMAVAAWFCFDADLRSQWSTIWRAAAAACTFVVALAVVWRVYPLFYSSYGLSSISPVKFYFRRALMSVIVSGIATAIASSGLGLAKYRGESALASPTTTAADKTKADHAATPASAAVQATAGVPAASEPADSAATAHTLEPASAAVGEASSPVGAPSVAPPARPGIARAEPPAPLAPTAPAPAHRSAAPATSEAPRTRTATQPNAERGMQGSHAQESVATGEGGSARPSAGAVSVGGVARPAPRSLATQATEATPASPAVVAPATAAAQRETAGAAQGTAQEQANSWPLGFPADNFIKKDPRAAERARADPAPAPAAREAAPPATSPTPAPAPEPKSAPANDWPAGFPRDNFK